MCLNLTKKTLLSSFAFNCNLRRYTMGMPQSHVEGGTAHCVQGSYDYYHYMQDRFDDNGWGQGLTLVHFSAQHKRIVWDRGCIQVLFRGC